MDDSGSVKQPTVLLVDDDRASREGLCMALEPSGYLCLQARTGRQALEVLQKHEVDVLITDIRMPEMDGMELFKRVQSDTPEVAVILITAYGEVEAAVQAMKEGAVDYITKPVKLDHVELSVARALAASRLKKENRDLRERLQGQANASRLLGNSPAIRKIMQTVSAVAPTRATVLLEGETGTGKEVLARTIHEISPRRDAPFVAVNCAALPETLLETELFGHEKGAFTGAEQRREGRFERADKGTLFLDEITEASLTTQVKLLRVLQDQRFERVGGSEPIHSDVRLIAATNVNVKERVGEGSFREDLYYRLNVVSIVVPPLRERKEDIPLLVAHFLSEIADEHEMERKEISQGALEALQQHHWPGNVRQLRNCVETMLVLSRGDSIGVEDIPRDILPIPPPIQPPPPAAAAPRGGTLDEIERQAILDALDRENGNRSAAARRLDVSRSTLYRKIKQHGLEGFAAKGNE